MSYRALYRQYRPQTFSGVVGQNAITTILKNQVAAGSVAHAYLFSGPRGTGKTSAAKILARAANCLNPQNGEPCMECDACLRTAQENVDILELDAASNNGVDDVRAIIDRARFLPLELRTKVYIIDEAHALSPNAFNALLKTLEEPPAHVLFILATTEPHRIPATITSRCQRMDFRRLSTADMVARMREVLISAGGEIEEAGLLAIARAAEGGMRDALSLADQCLSFCGNKVAAQDVYDLLGSMGGAFLFQMAEALLKGDAGAALAALDRVAAEGRDLKVFTRDLALHFRALLFAKLCGHCADIIDCSEDDMSTYLSQSKMASEEELLRACELLLSLEPRLRTLTLPRALIESTLVRIARPEEEKDLSALQVRLKRLEARLAALEAGGTVQKNNAGAAAASAGAPYQNAQSSETSLNNMALRENRAFSQAQIPLSPAGGPPSPADGPPSPTDGAAPNETPRENGAFAPAPFSPSPAGGPPSPAGGPPSPAGGPPNMAGGPGGQPNPAEFWKQVTGKLYEENRSAAVLARRAVRQEWHGTELAVRFESPVLLQAVSKPEIRDRLQGFLCELAPGCTLGLSMVEKADPLGKAKALFGDKLTIE